MKKIYKVKWQIYHENHADNGDWFPKECYKATKESAVLTVQNLKSAFEDLAFPKDKIQSITIEEVELT